MLKHDAIADFRFDPKTGKYRWISGAGKGQFAPKSAVLASTERFIVARSNDLVSLSRQVATQAIGLKDFQSAAGQALKDIHIAQAILGRGGVEKMQAEDWLSVGRTLKTQYYAGLGDDGKRYGLRHLAQDIADGKVSEAQLAARLKLYAQSGKRSYWQMQRTGAIEQGHTHARRVLGDAQHCADCAAWAGMGVQAIGKLPNPSEACSCKTNCRCSIRFGTFEELVGRLNLQ